MLYELRVFGVLQRLAVAYLVAAGFYALTAPKYYTPPRVSVRKNIFIYAFYLLCIATLNTLVLVYIFILWPVVSSTIRRRRVQGSEHLTLDRVY